MLFKTERPGRQQPAAEPFSPFSAASLALPKRLPVVLLGGAVVLAALYLASVAVHGDVAATVNGTGGRLDLNAEASLGSWYSSTLWILAALALLSAARQEWLLPVRRRGWLLLSVTSVYLSIDEATALHEAGSGVVARMFDLEGSIGWSVWVVPAGLAVAALLIVLLPFLRDLPWRTVTLLFLAGVIYVTGAAALEIVSAVMASRLGQDSVLFVLEIALEEFCEMAGITVFLYAILSHATRSVPRVP